MDNNDSKPQQTGGLKLMTVFIAVLALHVLVIGGFTVYHLMGSGGSDTDLALDKNHKLKADGTVVTDTATPDATTPDKSADVTASTDTAATPGTTGATGTTTAASTPAPDASASTTGSSTPATASAPAPAQVAANPPAAAAPAAPATTAAASPIVLSGDDMAQTSTIPAVLAPPPDATPMTGAPDLSQAPAPGSTPVAVVQAPSVTAPASPTPTHSAPLAATPEAEAISPAVSSGPIMPAGQVASGPVRMPANTPAPAATTHVASSEEHVAAPAHEEHTVASAHEAKKEIYTVKITDSYQKIAHSHHITVAELKAANHIKGSTLHAGQKLIIPPSKTLVAKSGADHDPVASEEASTASLSASPASSAKLHHHYYTVAKGDTLKKIAKKFDVSASALKEANNLSGTKVAVGEKLRIPSHEARANTSSASLTDHVAAPVTAPAPIQPSQVETQPAPIEQPAPTPVAAPAPTPQPTPASSPELTSLNF